MTKLKLLALGILAATAASTVQAESQWTVGAGAGVINSPYKQYDRDVYPVPVVTYEGDNFWFRGLGGGYYLWNDTADKLSIMAYYDPTHFKPGDSDSNALRQLDKRRSSLMAGLSYVHNTEYGFLRTALAGDTGQQQRLHLGSGVALSLYQRRSDADAGYRCAVQQRELQRLLLWRV